MIGVDMRGLIDKCNMLCTRALHAAAGMAVNRTHYEVTIEHFLMACLDESESDIPCMLKDAGISADYLRGALNHHLESLKNGNSGRPTFSPGIQDLLEAAWLVSSIDLYAARIRSGAMMLALLRRPTFYTQGEYVKELRKINHQEMQDNFSKIANISAEDSGPTEADTGEGGAQGTGGDGFIGRFCEDFTAKAGQGKMDPVFGRDAEIRQMVDILARRRKNNPILVGEPGVGKTAVMEGLALRIIQGDVPDVLQGVTLLGLDMGLLEAGASVKGEFERRLKGVLDEIKASPTPIILFIDEAHLLVGAGNAAGGSDAANLMKPALARGEIRTCAATTWKEYKKYFEKDPALARRFQLVKLDEPSPTTTTLILRGLRTSYEKAHGVPIRDAALEMAAQLSDRYIQGRFLPDKAVDLLDTACARIKVGMASTPAPLEDAQRALQADTRELTALERDAADGAAVDTERMAAIKEHMASLEAESATLHARWQEELTAAKAIVAARQTLEAARATGEDCQSALEALTAAHRNLEQLQGKDALIHVEVTPDAIARVVSDWTGVPVGKMAREQAHTVAQLGDILKKRICGQDAALSAVVEGIQAAKAGLRAPEQPLGVFLLVGPSGVGKTETGLALADALFGDERSVITVNMSEFQEKHTVSRLIGSPPGYVGYGEGGLLTEAVRRRPYSVVLLDEVEKAHPDVMQLFYQVFDKGTLCDGEGTEVSFRNTVIMLTSNLGWEIVRNMSAAAGDAVQDMRDSIAKALRPVLSKHFQPALLARMTLVPYVSLTQQALGGIAAHKLDALSKRMRQNNKMRLVWSDAIPQYLAACCTEHETGARNIEYILAAQIMPELSRRILAHMAEGIPAQEVELGLDKDGGLYMDFSTPTTAEDDPNAAQAADTSESSPVDGAEEASAPVARADADAPPAGLGNDTEASVTSPSAASSTTKKTKKEKNRG